MVQLYTVNDISIIKDEPTQILGVIYGPLVAPQEELNNFAGMLKLIPFD